MHLVDLCFIEVTLFISFYAVCRFQCRRQVNRTAKYAYELVIMDKGENVLQGMICILLEDGSS